MDINFIVTCYDKEEYLPYLLKVFQSYKKINVTYTVVYTGNDSEFAADIKIPNRGHSKGDYDCIVHGYLNLKNRNTNTRYIKIGIDSWLLNEDKIIDIFTKMEESKAGYAGIWWDVHKDDISTDIFFADTRYGNIFETLIVNDVPDHLIHRLEVFMYQIINATNINVHYLEDRWPTWSDGRWQCDKLGWTMSHDLQTNINYLNSYKNESSIVGEN